MCVYFNSWGSYGTIYASFYQISSRSVRLLLRYSNFSTFQYVACCHPGFSKIRYFNRQSAAGGQYASSWHISSKLVKWLQSCHSLTFFFEIAAVCHLAFLTLAVTVKEPILLYQISCRSVEPLLIYSNFSLDVKPDLSIFWFLSLTLIVPHIHIFFKFGQFAPSVIYNTHTHLMALFRDYPGEPVPKRQNQSGFYWRKRQWVAVASAGPYTSLHLAPDR